MSITTTNCPVCRCDWRKAEWTLGCDGCDGGHLLKMRDGKFYVREGHDWKVRTKVQLLSDKARKAFADADLKVEDLENRLRKLFNDPDGHDDYDNDEGKHSKPDLKAVKSLYYESKLDTVSNGIAAFVSARFGTFQNTVLHRCAFAGDFKTVAWILDELEIAGVTQEFIHSLSYLSLGTALHSAAAGGHRSIAELLIQHGCSIRAVATGNVPNWTPLISAQLRNHSQLYDILRSS